MEEILAKLESLARSIASKSQNLPDMDSAFIAGAPLFVELKRLSRELHDQITATSSVSELERSKTDSAFLSLQNLLYEKNFLRREVLLCKEFSIGDPVLLAGGSSFVPTESTSPHDQKADIAALQSETKQREALLAHFRVQPVPPPPSRARPWKAAAARSQLPSTRSRRSSPNSGRAFAAS